MRQNVSVILPTGFFAQINLKLGSHTHPWELAARLFTLLDQTDKVDFNSMKKSRIPLQKYN